MHRSLEPQRGVATTSQGLQEHEISQVEPSTDIQQMVGILKSDGNPLGHLLLHRVVSIHDCLLIDDDLCRIGFWSADS